ncbi:MAG: hypothetical protein ACR2J8_05330, partial [Thermomicrobiales bacterium]
MAEFGVEVGEVIQPLVDLGQQVGPRAFDVLVSQLDQHLSHPPDGANGVNRIVFAAWMGVSAHECSPEMSSGLGWCDAFEQRHQLRLA